MRRTETRCDRCRTVLINGSPEAINWKQIRVSGQHEFDLCDECGQEHEDFLLNRESEQTEK